MPEIQNFEPLWGEWHTTDLLGRGSYGTVYLAEKKEFGVSYYSAVKHIALPATKQEIESLYTEGLIYDEPSARSYYKQIVESLMQEIDINYKLKGHTNIVSYEDHKILERTDAPGYDLFIKMEFLTSLPDHIRGHDMTLRDIVKLGTDICSALAVLRQEHTIHRDIKPANIFINSGGHYKLGDFGVARTMERTTGGMSARGTYSYMAPELVHGRDADYRVDIYSLGVLLYRFLNGNRTPFLPPPPAPVTHEENMDALERRLKGEALPPPAFADTQLWKIIQRACEFYPENRWRSAEDMHVALMKYIAGVPMEVADRVVLEQRQAHGPLYTDASNSGNARLQAEKEKEEHTAKVFLSEETGMPAAEAPELEPTEYLPATAAQPPVNRTAEAPPQGKDTRRFVLLAGIAAAVLLPVVIAALLLLPKPQPEASNGPPDTPNLIGAQTNPAPEEAEASAPPAPVSEEHPAAPVPEEVSPAAPEAEAPSAPEPPPSPSRAPSPSPSPSRAPPPSPPTAPSPEPSPEPSPLPEPSPAPSPTPVDTPPPTPQIVSVTGISLSRGAAILDAGGSLKLSATVTPDNATDRTLTWSTSNSSVATVDSSGNVSAVGRGVAVITVSCGGHQATCEITVT